MRNSSYLRVMLVEIGNHKASGSFHFISYFSPYTNGIGGVIRGKPSKYAISPAALHKNPRRGYAPLLHGNSSACNFIERLSFV